MIGVFIINNKLNIGFLASSFANRYGSGTAKVFESLIKLLCNKYSSEVDVTIFCNSHDQYVYLRNDPSFSKAKIIVFPAVKGKWLKSSRQYFKYSFIYKSSKIDILHFSVPRFYPFFWLFPAKKFICTFHAGGDVTAIKDKIILSREIYNLTAKLFFRKLDSIIAVSNYGKKEISQAYGIPSQLISVIHPGTNDIWHVMKTEQIKYTKDDRKLVLIIGRWQKYKNIQVVSKVLSMSSPSQLTNYHFVFLGKRISKNANIIKTDLAKVDKKVYEVIDYLDENDYVSIISEANLVIIPSINEGFSLPIFDAYSLGARLLIHGPSPAAEILVGKKGVHITDLHTSDNLLPLIELAINQQVGSLVDNQFFLKSIGATWEDMTENYLKQYYKVCQEFEA